MALRPLKLLMRLDDRLTGGLKKVGRGLRDLNRPADGLARRLGKVGGVLLSIAKRAALFGAGLVGSLGLAVLKTIDFADSLAKVAQRLRISNGELQELRLVSKGANVSQETLEKGLGALSARMGKIKGVTGGVVGAMEKVADRIAKTENPLRQAAIAQAYFGKVGLQLLPILRLGSEGIRRQREEWRKLGVILDDETIAAAERADDQLDRLKAIASSLSVRLLSSLVPTVDKLSGKLIAWIGANRELINSRLEQFGNTLATSFENLATSLPTVAANLSEVAGSLNTIAGALGAIRRLGHAVFNPIETLQGISARTLSATQFRQRGVAPFASQALPNLAKPTQQVEVSIRVLSDPAGRSQSLGPVKGGKVGLTLDPDRGLILATP